GTFTATPMVVLPSPPVQPFQTVIVPAQIVFISNQIPIPGQTIIPVQPPVAGQMPIAGQPAAPIWTRPGTPAVPGAGTPRHEVLRLFGQPSVIVSTSTCDTLYFSNGVTVIIQNDQVIRPR